MDLARLLERSWPDAHPAGIPWHERSFSERMLTEHVDESHDLASRRSALLDRHVRRMHEILGGPTDVLDLACGPGLYGERLARLGHTYTGIDIAPAAIAYALEHADTGAEYVLGDVREVPFGVDRGCASMLFGQIDTFSPDDATSILTRCHEALRPGGALILEAHTQALVDELGARPATWSVHERGLFSEGPHLVLTDHRRTATFADARHTVIHGDETMHEYIVRTYARSPEAWNSWLHEIGFVGLEAGPPFTREEGDRGFSVIVARRG